MTTTPNKCITYCISRSLSCSLAGHKSQPLHTKPLSQHLLSYSLYSLALFASLLLGGASIHVHSQSVPPTGVATGRVVASDGNGLAEALVTANCVNGLQFAQVTATDGSYRLTSLPLGSSCSFTAAKSLPYPTAINGALPTGYKTVALPPRVIVATNQGITFTLPLVVSVAGYAYNSARDNAGLPNLRVTATPLNPSLPECSTPVTPVSTDVNGRYMLNGLLAQCSYRLTITGTPYVWRANPLTFPNAANDYNFSGGLALNIEGTIRGGSCTSQPTVTIKGTDTTQRPIVSVLSYDPCIFDYRLAGLVPAPYQITVRAQNDTSGNVPQVSDQSCAGSGLCVRDFQIFALTAGLSSKSANPEDFFEGAAQSDSSEASNNKFTKPEELFLGVTGNDSYAIAAYDDFNSERLFASRWTATSGLTLASGLLRVCPGSSTKSIASQSAFFDFVNNNNLYVKQIKLSALSGSSLTLSLPNISYAVRLNTDSNGNVTFQESTNSGSSYTTLQIQTPPATSNIFLLKLSLDKSQKSAPNLRAYLTWGTQSANGTLISTAAASSTKVTVTFNNSGSPNPSNCPGINGQTIDSIDID